MTADQRLDRIEHLTAGIAEERRKDREEYKTLWRDTQHQINALATETKLRFDQVAERIDEVAGHIDELAEETRTRTQKLAESDDKLDARIEALVSAIGQLVAKG
jgi:methyl-accepting chemotaxis protein